LEVEAERVART